MRTRTRPFSCRRLLQLTAGTVGGGSRYLAHGSWRPKTAGSSPRLTRASPTRLRPRSPLDRADRPCPFRVHGDSFQILSRNGVPPPAHEGGWKDVALVHPNETVRIIKRFFD